MGERADRPWVGEPGRLSPEDRERFKDDRLRLVCNRLDCLVIFRNRELHFLLQERERKREREREVGEGEIRCRKIPKHPQQALDS